MLPLFTEVSDIRLALELEPSQQVCLAPENAQCTALNLTHSNPGWVSGPFTL